MLLIKLFTSTFKISACTFGGGFVIIPLMRQKFVEELGWIEEQEMLDLTAIAQSSPGAIAVNVSILVGYHVAGVTGALAAVIGTVLPPLVIISVVSMFYQAFRDNLMVNAVMDGMLCGVAAVVLDVVVGMARSIVLQRRILYMMIMIVSFIAVRLYDVNIIFIIISSGFIGAMDSVYRAKWNKKGDIV